MGTYETSNLALRVQIPSIAPKLTKANRQSAIGNWQCLCGYSQDGLRRRSAKPLIISSILITRSNFFSKRAAKALISSLHQINLTKGDARERMLTSRVLLLNFSYEPLGTVGVARAMCMIFRGAVFVEEYDGDNVLHSPKETWRVPSVIRLRSYINVRRRRQASAMKRMRIYIRDKFRCQYCGNKHSGNELTLDHITPRAQGGESIPENLVSACIECNQRKGNRTPEQARMPLLTSQKLLSVGLDRVLLCHYAESKPQWKKYLFLEDQEEMVA